MDILIKGMEMPENTTSIEIIFRDYEKMLQRERRFITSVIEVPTPHGRLIDADELLKDSETIMLETIDDHEEVEEMIKDAPTVIEAEGEE